MRTKSLFAVLALSLIATTLSAQENNPQRGQRRQRMDTTEMFNRQAERLVKQLKLDDEKKGKAGAIDRKLKRKIDEKKQALGLKQG